MFARYFRCLSKGLINLNNFRASNWTDKLPKNHQKVMKSNRKYDDANQRKEKASYWSKFRSQEYRQHFQQRQDQLDEPSKTIIQDLNVTHPDNAEIGGRLQRYLNQKSSSNFLTETPANKINLLVALEMRGNLPPKDHQHFRRVIIEHILRHQTQNLILDQKSLIILVKTLENFRQHQAPSIKWSSIKYLVFHLLQTNFAAIPLGNYTFIVKLLNSELKSSSLDNFKYMKFIGMLQERINRIFLEILRDELVADEYKFILHHEFMMELMEVYDVNGLAKDQYGHTLYQFLIRKYFGKSFTNPHLAIINYNVIYRFFPSRLANNSQENLKLSILRHIIALYEGNQQLRNEILNSRESQHLCYSILTHFFHSKLQSLLRQQNGVTFISQNAIVSPPDLPDFFWKLYQANTSYLNKYPIIRFTIKDCYPDRFIPTQQVEYNVSQTSNETEMNTRVTECLSKMKMPFRNQEFIAGRVIDFSLENSVLLEVDGVFHFQARNLVPNDSTNYRNLHLLLSGYRLMVINIYEYNICREPQQLMQLISRKLQMLNSGAIFIM